MQKKGEDLNKDQKEQVKKKDEILVRLSESELIMDTLASKLDDKVVTKGEDKKQSAEKESKPEVEQVQVEVLREVANVDLAVLCCQLRLVNWTMCNTLGAGLVQYEVTQ
mmetsp:Transcript_45392/g.38240  ORF Transcript_45392/g.38240 Transcript_45392/m.38240 type:complete len:109 (+) Transcript_45392:114-440(+)